MSSKKSTIISENPFKSNLQIVVTKVIESTREGTSITRLENKPYVKIFSHHVEQKNKINNLTPIASKIFNYIIFNINVNTDYIELNVTNLNKVTNMAEATIRKAIVELCDVCLITRRESMKATYWINPSYVYSGNRITAFPECITTEYIWDKRNSKDKEINFDNI